MTQTTIDSTYATNNNNAMDLVNGSESVDCVFIIDGEQIEAHKLKLSTRSPVFEKMFFGKMACERIIITDVNSKTFKQMLQFIYTNDVNIESVLEAWSLYYVAEKYILNDLAQKCTIFIQNNLRIGNLALSYEYADMYGITVLKKICMCNIMIYVRAILLENYCNYHMKPSSIISILEQKFLNIRNEDLIKGILHWTGIECNLEDIVATPKNIVDYLDSKNILSFLSNLNYNSDSAEDHLFLQSYQLIKQLKSVTVPQKTYLKPYQYWLHFCQYRLIYKISARMEIRGSNILLSNISVNQNVILFGLALASVDNGPSVFCDFKTKADISVIIQITADGIPGLCSVTIQDIDPHLESYIPLSDLLFMECDKMYSFRITYTSSNFREHYSVLCNYMSNKLIDTRRDVTFLFDDQSYGSVIKGICYCPV